MKIIVIFACSILCLVLTSSVFEAFAVFEDDLKNLPILAAENKRTFERVLDFIQQCGDKVTNDRSLISTCDSLFQKLEIDVSKFLVENQAVIEDFLYPYFLPSNFHTLAGLSSENVTGSTDPTVIVKHPAIFLDYSKPISGIIEECLRRTTASYEMQTMETCMGIVKSLNSHLKVFNQNARSDFEKMFNAPIP